MKRLISGVMPHQNAKWCQITALFTLYLDTNTQVDLLLSDAVFATSAASSKKKRVRARAEATQQDLRMYAKQFLEAKRLEYESWKKNDVFDLVDLRKTTPKKKTL